MFKKILLAIKFCHNRKLCHLDIKPENIMLDKNFAPIIIDFGFAQKCKDEKDQIIRLKIKLGTEDYACPEMWDDDPDSTYNGIKADIFSLGVVLFNLVTGKPAFENNAKETDSLYGLILKDNDGTFKDYWDEMKNRVKVPLSNNFKKLYMQMIAHKPENRLESFDDILNSDWMTELDNLSSEEKKAL
jgi:serine/threonine protein kinase